MILETHDLSMHFGGVRAVEGVDFSVSKGRITSLIGPNGAGKTTMFNMITGIYKPTRGNITYHRRDNSTLDVSAVPVHKLCRNGIARTFQNIRLFTDLPAEENVKLGMHARTKSGFLASIFTMPWAMDEERSIDDAARHYLAFVGLKDQANELADSLSYGNQRRLEIARALATDPQLLLLDEPAAGMNPQETEELMELIVRIRDAGITVCLIEHDMPLVMRVSDYIYVLDHGELIAKGEPREIQGDPNVIEAYLGGDDDDA